MSEKRLLLTHLFLIVFFLIVEVVTTASTRIVVASGLIFPEEKIGATGAKWTMITIRCHHAFSHIHLDVLTIGLDIYLLHFTIVFLPLIIYKPALRAEVFCLVSDTLRPCRS